MGQRLHQAGNWIVNAAIVVVAACFVILTVSKIRERQAGPLPQQLHVGDPILLPPDLRGQPVLLVALQTDCHFCEESMPFYKSINERSNSLNAHLLFIFPESAAAGRVVLSEHGVVARDVRQMDFANLKIAGTPTVLLLSADGHVNDLWVGKLSEARQEQVQQAVSPQSP